MTVNPRVVALLAASLFLVGCGSGTPAAAPTSTGPAASGSPARSSSPDATIMAVLGDSIASGSPEGGNGVKGWPAIVAQTLGLTLFNRGQPGTGYTISFAQGGRPYPARVDEIIRNNPAVVIVEGSRNDLDAEATKTAATDVLGKLRRGLPQARILVIGPIYSYETNVGTTPVNDAVKAAAASAGLTYVDTVKAGWFTGAAHSLIGSDGVHPTDEGHRYLAELIAPFVRSLPPAS